MNGAGVWVGSLCEVATLWQSSVRRGWIEVHAHFVAVLCEARAVGSLGAVV